MASLLYLMCSLVKREHNSSPLEIYITSFPWTKSRKPIATLSHFHGKSSDELLPLISSVQTITVKTRYVIYIGLNHFHRIPWERRKLHLYNTFLKIFFSVKGEDVLAMTTVLDSSYLGSIVMYRTYPYNLHFSPPPFISINTPHSVTVPWVALGPVIG